MPLLPLEPYLNPVNLLATSQEPSDPGGQWWVLHTRPRAEKALARRLLRSQAAFFLPLYEQRRISNGRRQCSHLPLFPGYVFLHGGHDSRLVALSTNLVAQVLPAIHHRQLHEDLARVYRLMNSGHPLTPVEHLQPGQSVVIAQGPMAGLEGCILQRATSWKLIVEVRFLQRGVAVELEDWMLESVSRSSAACLNSAD